MVFMGKPQEKPPKKPPNKKAQAVRAKAAQAKLEDVQSKQELLHQLTQQAEFNTKILERERAMVMAMGIQAPAPGAMQSNAHGPSQFGYNAPPPNELTIVKPGRDPYSGNGPRHAPPGGFGAPPQQRRQQQQQQQPRNASKQHNFLNVAPTRMYDASQVPGLGGPPLPPEPQSPFAGLEGGVNTPSGPDGTFPDSPSFYPGMVFAIPVADAPEAPPRPNKAAPPSSKNAQQAGGLPRRQQAQQQQQQPMQQRQEYHQGAPEPKSVGGMDAWGPPHPYQGQGAQSPPAADPRGYGEDPKAAYRRELEEQIRIKKQMKQQEEEARRRADEAAEARAAAALPPWDPAARRGGGGEPLRDMDGRPVADLKWQKQHGQQQSSPRSMGWGPGPGPGQGGFGGGGGGVYGMGGPVGMMGAPPVSPGFQNMPPPRRAPPRLSVEIPGNPMHHPMSPHNPMGGAPGAPPYGMPPQGPPNFPPQGPMQPPFGFPAQGPAVNGWLGQPPMHNGGVGGGGGAAPLSPGAVSPGGGAGGDGKMYRGAMQELRAGPSEDQRRRAEEQRLQLQRDLEEQIRQKKERQAQERAAEEAARRKEEAELKAYYDKLAADQEEEKRAQKMRAKEEAAAEQAAAAAAAHVSPQGPYGGGHGGGGKPRRGGKHVIEADWLDQAPGGGGGGGGAQGQGGALEAEPSAGPARFGRRATHDAEGPLGLGPAPNHRASQQAWPPPVAPEAVGGEVGGLLSALQQEQARLREDLARQQQLMEKLSQDAGNALAERDKAKKEVERVRAALAGRAPPPLDTSALGASTDALDQFVVSTHLVPRDVNSIPTRLPTPLEADWAAAREPLLAPHARLEQEPSYGGAGALSPHGFGGVGALSPHGYGSQEDILDQLMHQVRVAEFEGGMGFPLRNSRSAGDGPGYDYSDEMGMYRPVSRIPARPSQIPRPPGLNVPQGPRMHIGANYPHHSPKGHYNAYFEQFEDGGWGGMGGGGMGSPMRSKYGAAGGGRARIGGPSGHYEPPQQQQQQQQQPPAVFGRRAGPGGAGAAGRPPPSPAILRGDLLQASPDTKQRKAGTHVAAQAGVARGRAGRQVQESTSGAAPAPVPTRRPRPQRRSNPDPSTAPPQQASPTLTPPSLGESADIELKGGSVLVTAHTHTSLSSPLIEELPDMPELGPPVPKINPFNSFANAPPLPPPRGASAASAGPVASSRPTSALLSKPGSAAGSRAGTVTPSSRPGTGLAD